MAVYMEFSVILNIVMGLALGLCKRHCEILPIVRMTTSHIPMSWVNIYIIAIKKDWQNSANLFYASLPTDVVERGFF